MKLMLFREVLPTLSLAGLATIGLGTAAHAETSDRAANHPASDAKIELSDVSAIAPSAFTSASDFQIAQDFEPMEPSDEMDEDMEMEDESDPFDGFDDEPDEGDLEIEERPPRRRNRPDPIRRRVFEYGYNYVGLGGNIGDNNDLIDFTVISKFQLTDFEAGDRNFGLSVRPSLALSNSIVDIRFPVTADWPGFGGTVSREVNKLDPFAGAGLAVSVDDDDDTEFDFMLTAGADYPLPRNLTAMGQLNFLFLDDIDLEFQFGIGYNF